MRVLDRLLGSIFTASNEAPPARGTESDPIIKRNGAGSPVKYCCVVCQRWFVESESEMWMRREEVSCQSCDNAALEAEWQLYRRDADTAWKEYEK